MKMTLRALTLSCACLTGFSTLALADSSERKSDLINADGEVVGSVRLAESERGLYIGIDARKLPAGVRALHFHEKAACDADKGFESAGAHYNPDDSQHGYEADRGPHAGDLPNQTVDDDGRLRVEFLAPALTLRGGDAPLLDADGSALIVHAARDDYRSQPSGDAGARIACAAFTR